MCKFFFFWTFYPVPLIYISVSVPIPYCFWWLEICTIVLNQGAWFLQFCFSFSHWLWLFCVFCVSKQILNEVTSAVKKKKWVKSCHWKQHEWTKRVCEINQTEKTNTICFHLCVEAKDQNKWTFTTKQKHSHRYREQTGKLPEGRRVGDERSRWGKLRHTNFQLQNKWVRVMKCIVWKKTF